MDHYVDLLYRRKRTIFISVLLVVALGAVYTFTRTPLYVANSYVMLDLDQRKAPSGRGNLEVAQGDIFSQNDRSLLGELFMIRTSPQLAERVFARLGNSHYLEGAPSFEVQFSPVAQDVNIIRISATSVAPDTAWMLANLYAEEYVNLTRDASRTYLSSSREELQQQEEKWQAALREAETEIENYLRRGGSATLDDESRYVARQIADLEAQRDNARIELETRQTSLDAIEKELQGIDPQLARRVSSSIELQIKGLQEKIAEREIAKEEMFLRYPNLRESGTESAEIQALNREIGLLQAQLGRLSEQYIEEVKAAGGISGSEGSLDYLADLRRRSLEERIRISGIETTIRVTEQRLATYRADLQTIPERAMELAQLQRQRDYAERMYQFVIEQLQEKQVAEVAEPGYARVLRSAGLPEDPVSPNVSENMILSLVFGLMLGLGLVFLQGRFDSRIYKPEHLQDRRARILGVVPNLGPLIRSGHGGSAYVERDGRRLSTALVVILNPDTAAAEVYRQMVTLTRIRLPGADTNRVVVVTSSGIGEGKSVTAANLAVAMAQAGYRTLLVDADMRRPRVHQLFGIGLGEGFAGLLSREGEGSIDSASVGINRLQVLTAGRPDIDVPVLLNADRLQRALTTLKASFDFIVVDTPPLRAAADALLLAQQAEGTVLVARAGATKKAELEYGMYLLNEVKASLLGVVLNGFEVSMAYGYKFRYDHYTRYDHYAGSNYYAASSQSGDGVSARFKAPA